MVQERAQRRLAAITRLADVVGYSELMEADEAGTLAVCKDRRARYTSAYGRRAPKHLKQMGDAVLIEFASAVNAVTCAIDLQKAMAGAASADDGRIQLRVGINTGDVIVEGDDLYGDGVNIAAQIEALAEPGGVLCRRRWSTMFAAKSPLPSSTRASRC